MTPVKLGPEMRTLPAMLVRNAETDPGAAFIHDESGTLNRAGAVELGTGMANAFVRLGVERGDTVAIMLDNCREFLAGWFGLGFMGAIEVPVNPANGGPRTAHILNDARCRVLITTSANLEQIEAVADQIEFLELVVLVGGGESDRFQTIDWQELDADPVGGEIPVVDYSDPVAVMYTSGSTGPAKGALISHGHHWTNGWQPTGLFGIDPSDTLYCCLPLHHNMAQGYGVWAAIVSGGAISLAPRFKADTFWSEIAEHDATILSFVGAMLVLLAKRPEEPGDSDNSLRLGFGIPIPPELHEKFESRFGMELVHAYGSTEATIVAWNHGPDRVVGAAGQVLEEYSVRIADERDVALPRGEIGEILVRPDEPYSMFSGYWNDPERTVNVWRNLWFHTGDRGRFDEKGNLWFEDRIGDVVRRMGEFISSYEVEQVLVGHPAIQLVAAFGVPSELVEEELMVSIILNEGASLTAAELREWCDGRLSNFAIPRFVDFRSELPLTPTGKIEKFKLKKEGVTRTTDDARANKKEVNAN
ncbi:MAG: AMP-binding protein [Solirubrobacterales bacterium]